MIHYPFEQTRRQFIRNTALVAASIAVSPALRAEPNLPASSHFPLGVASGDVTSTHAIVWTRYDGTLELQLRLWKGSDTNLSQPLLCTDVKTRAGGFVHIDIVSLTPDCRYQYAFVELDASKRPVKRSLVGRFKTAPALDSLSPLTFGASCCTFNLFQPAVLSHAAKRSDLDFFMLLGDTSYNDGCVTVSDFRAKWANNLSKAGYVDLRQSTSVIATIDDHEIANDFNPETIDPRTLAAGINCFFEHTPMRVNRERPGQIWRKLSWGQTADIFVLDCRTERLPSTRHTSREQYISRSQMDWLKNGLSQSNAAFKIIMNSVPITEFSMHSQADRWEGYPTQRLEILRFIDDHRISGILWVSGDFHFASIGQVSPSGVGSGQTEILVGPGAQMPNFGCLSLNLNPQFKWASAKNNYTVLHLDPQSMEVDMEVQGASSNPLDIQPASVGEAFRHKWRHR